METTIQGLRCEHRSNPLGIDSAQPRLSWQLCSPRHGTRQTAYQLRVASSPERLQAGQADLWDSGQVASAQSHLVAYAGPPLSSGQRAWWQVRVWDERGQPADSTEPAWWEAGLLERHEWVGRWIGAALVGGPRSTVPCPFLRRTFVVAAPVATARLYVTALGLYECSINGQRVGTDLLTPGWTDYHTRVQYQVYDVSDMLRQGENVLAALLGDGWYCGHVAWFNRQHYGDRPKLLAQLVITGSDGSRQTIASDEHWKTSFGPLLESDLLMGESYDARLAFPGWDAPGFDDTRWLPVEQFPEQPAALVAMCGPPVRATAELVPVDAPTAIEHSWQSRWIFDLGQNMVGRVRLRVSGPPGTTVTLRYSEMLNPNGSLYTDNLRTARQTDHYTLAGTGEEVYEPRFTFHGFRYVELTGLPGQPDRGTITGVVLHSDTPVTGSFVCSEPLLNQLQRNIDWGQRGNFVDLPTDCPQRDERMGWLGDAQVFIRTAAFNRDVAGFFTKWFQDVADAQRTDGAFPPVAPNPGFALDDGGPAWADAGVICPWTIYQCYGDTGPLAQHYDAMARFLAYLERTSRDGIRAYADYSGFRGFGDWLAQDGTTTRGGSTPKELIGTAFFAHSAQLMSQIAATLGRPADAKRYAQLFDTVRQAFVRAFVTPAGGLVNPTQTACVLALHFDLLPKALRAQAVEQLTNDIVARNHHLSTGFVGTPYLLQVLTEAGRLDLAYALLLQRSWPSWLYPVLQGATTIWERWDGWTEETGFQDPSMNSFNHYAYGAVGAWLYSVVAGIELDSAGPGYQAIVLRPRPGGELRWAEATHESPYGPIASAWHRGEDGSFSWRVSVPPNTSATAYLPATPTAQITVAGPAELLRHEPEAAVYRLTAGSYQFSVGAAGSADAPV